MNKKELESLAKDLTKEYPRSPREMLGGYVIVARCLDKCRAFLVGKNGEYSFLPCSLCNQLIAFTGIDPEDFKNFAATGASDEEVGDWVRAKSKIKDPMKVIRWNNKMRDMRLSEMSDEAQAYLENYVPKNLPKHRPVCVRVVRCFRSGRRQVVKNHSASGEDRRL